MEDPLTHAQYVLVRLDAYEQLQQGADYDMSDPDPRAFYPAFAAAVQDDLDAPGMEGYDANGITPLPAIPKAAGIGARSAAAGTGS